MKSFSLMLFLGVTLSFNSYSQTVNDVPLNQIAVDYVQIVGTTVNLTGTKLAIQIDFGQQNKLFKDNTALKDENGKMIKFNSMIDALNFMCGNGYDFVQAYAVSVGSSGKVYHYLLRRRKD